MLTPESSRCLHQIVGQKHVPSQRSIAARLDSDRVIKRVEQMHSCTARQHNSVTVDVRRLNDFDIHYEQALSQPFRGIGQATDQNSGDLRQPMEWLRREYLPTAQLRQRC